MEAPGESKSTSEKPFDSHNSEGNAETSADPAANNGTQSQLPQKLSMFGAATYTKAELADVSPKALAHLGDAVFHLFEREREIRLASTARQMHTRARVSAERQSDLLDVISPHLTDAEADIVRRARNIRPGNARRSEQVAYRRATAFEALLGYLYLSDPARLKVVLTMTLDS